MRTMCQALCLALGLEDKVASACVRCLGREEEEGGRVPNSPVRREEVGNEVWEGKPGKGDSLGKGLQVGSGRQAVSKSM